ncbi:60S ribosomal protein [Musa troglodytarum]|uniref:60S ribosomal protein n=1 Tax=Musa troglodytarum TaxID=320322 RepID=A0A9E7KMC7_9LILI|nr:60S ribosomal protein [Musa troglodytarum]URE21094.1 60S ribosomal protein [Musa troglodytarum]
MLEPKSNPTGLHLFILPTWRNAASPSPSDKREPGRQSTGFLVEYLGFSAPLQPRLFSGPTAEVPSHKTFRIKKKLAKRMRQIGRYLTGSA